MTNQNHKIERLLTLLVWGFLVVFAVVIVSNYLQLSWTELLSFKVNDGWCLPKQGLGEHCFGDFGTAYNLGKFGPSYYFNGVVPDVSFFYHPQSYIVTNTPPTIVLFLLLRLLPYNSALSIYLLTSFLSLFATIWWGTQKMARVHRAVAVVFGGVLSFGFLTAFDRGNHVTLLLFPAVMFVSGVATENRRRILLWAIPLLLLKFWGIFFLVALIARRFWRDFFLLLGLTAVSYLMPLAFFGGGFITNLRTMLAVNTNPDLYRLTAPYSLSLSGLVRRTICAVQSSGSCNLSAADKSYSWMAPLSVLILIAFLAIVLLALRRKQTGEVVSSALLLLIPILAIPDAGSYNAVFAVGILSCAIRHWNVEGSNHTQTYQSMSDNTPDNVLMLALVCSITPLAGRFTSDSVFSITNGNQAPTIVLQPWLIPLAWLSWMGTIAVHQYRLARTRKTG